jgi:hypothetical protein
MIAGRRGRSIRIRILPVAVRERESNPFEPDVPQDDQRKRRFASRWQKR